MRISTAQLHHQAIQLMGNQQSELFKLQKQLNTGYRINAPSDDPAGSATMLMLNQSVQNNQQYQSNIDSASTRLQLEETALSSVNDQLSRAKELALAGNTDSYGALDRATLAQEAQHILDAVRGLANTMDQSGDYLFAGNTSQSIPFAVQSGGGTVYQGDDGARMIKVSGGRQIQAGDSGNAVFMGIRNGNGTFSVSANAGNAGTGQVDGGSLTGTFVPDDYTVNFLQPVPGGPITYDVRDSSNVQVATGAYTSGAQITFNGVSVSFKGTPANGDAFQVNQSRNQDVFTTLQNLVNALNAPITTPAEQAQLHNQLGAVISDLDQSMTHMQQVIAGLGARQSTLDAQKSVNDTLILHDQIAVSTVRDLDFAAAISKFNQQTVALQAAQKTYVQLQGLSLFSYL